MRVHTAFVLCFVMICRRRVDMRTMCGCGDFTCRMNMDVGLRAARQNDKSEREKRRHHQPETKENTAIHCNEV